MRDISNTFDEFWNSIAAVPIEALVKETHNLDDFHRQMGVLRRQIAKGNYPYPLDADVHTLKTRINTIRKQFIWARGEVFNDTFASMKNREQGQTVMAQIGREILKTRKELLIESAYFVMRDTGVEYARELNRRGVKLRVLTNSLASNNVLAAQAGHNKRRKELIAAGADLYELRPDAAAVRQEVTPEGKNCITTLHTKALVIDGEKAFVGSYNLDPRSAEINSEIGLFVHSRAFASKVRDYLNQGVAPKNAYRVTLDDRGRLRWRTTVDGQTKTWSEDPETSGFKRFKAGAIGILPISSQLCPPGENRGLTPGNRTVNLVRIS